MPDAAVSAMYPPSMPENIGRTRDFDEGLRAKRGDRAGKFKDAERPGAYAVND